MDISNVRNEVGEFGYISPCESVQSILSAKITATRSHVLHCYQMLARAPNSPPASKNVAAAVVASASNIEV